jgi:hypothetical protein
MKNTRASLVIAFASLALVACAAAPSGGTRAVASAPSLPPGISPTAGSIQFMSCVSKLDGGPDLTELRVGGGRYILCTSYANDDGQATQEAMDDDGNIWDITWTYDSVKAGGPKEVVLDLVTNVVGQPWVVKATRDGDEIVIPVPTWSGAQVSPIWIDLGGNVISWTPASSS